MLSKKHGHRRRTRARAKHGMTDAELVEFIYQGSKYIRSLYSLSTTPKGLEMYYSASKMVRILLLVSAYSSSASESATTPHPA